MRYKLWYISGLFLWLQAMPAVAQVAKLKAWVWGEGHQVSWNYFEQATLDTFSVSLDRIEKEHTSIITSFPPENGAEQKSIFPFGFFLLNKIHPNTSFTQKLLVWENSSKIFVPAVVTQLHRTTISTDSLLILWEKQPDLSINTRAYARERLLDFWIGDWHQPANDWLWEMPLEGHSTIEPLPINRVEAFSKFDGISLEFEQMASFSHRKYQSFFKTTNITRGFCETITPLDERLLVYLSLETWQQEAMALQRNFSDDFIEEMVQALPPNIYEIVGKQFIETLKKRRELLPQFAEDFYRKLAKTVEIVGSQATDMFLVVRNEERTEVQVFSGNKRNPYRQKTFINTDTREIRLYGLKGKDTFEIVGASNSPIKIIAIGEDGDDVLIDHTKTSKLNRTSFFVERPLSAPELLPLNYDFNLPLSYFNYNETDGVFVGGGINVIQHGFNKKPYAKSHRFYTNFALRTFGFNARYRGRYIEKIGSWDLLLEADYLNPKKSLTFFKLGNETQNTLQESTFYNAPFKRFFVALDLLKEKPHYWVKAGIFAKYFDVEVEEDSDLPFIQPDIIEKPFQDNWFLGIEAEATLRKMDNLKNPHRGIRWTNHVTLNQSGIARQTHYLKAQSEAAIYYSPQKLITLAYRIGGEKIFGNFPFYDASTLGEFENLRGFRRRRFAGNASVYQNTEVRFRLFNRLPFVGAVEAGPLLFWDMGKVFTQGETSSLWHQGYGIGGWLVHNNQFIYSGALGFSNENKGWISFKTAFQF